MSCLCIPGQKCGGKFSFHSVGCFLTLKITSFSAWMLVSLIVWSTVIYPVDCFMCIWEECVYHLLLIEKFCMSFTIIWSMLFKSAVSLLIFHLDVPCIIESRILNSQNIIVLLSNFSFRSVYICFICLCALYIWICVYL